MGVPVRRRCRIRVTRSTSSSACCVWAAIRCRSATPSASAHPRQTNRILELMIRAVGAEHLAMHMHDTRGTALANVLVGLEVGIRHFDASVGGLGGCPYAPGAAGNLATRISLYMLDGMGVSTGIDLRTIGRSLAGRRELGRASASRKGAPSRRSQPQGMMVDGALGGSPALISQRERRPSRARAPRAPWESSGIGGVARRA